MPYLYVEMPVSAYYRIAAINTDKLVFIRVMERLLQNGQIKWLSHYNTKGERDGVFKSFMPMAIKSRNSDYHNDTLSGICSFYDSSGNFTNAT